MQIASDHVLRIPPEEQAASQASPLWPDILDLAPPSTRELREIDLTVDRLEAYAALVGQVTGRAMGTGAGWRWLGLDGNPRTGPDSQEGQADVTAPLQRRPGHQRRPGRRCRRFSSRRVHDHDTAFG